MSAATYGDLIRHPKQLRQVVGQCNEMTPAVAQASPLCQSAARAATFVNSVLQTLQTNQGQVGQEILHAQIKYAHLQEKLAALKTKANNNNQVKPAEIARLQQDVQMTRDEIDGRLAVLRMVEGNIS